MTNANASDHAPIAVIGTGYVGLVTAVALAALGHEVCCLDIDAEKVARLRRGEAPFVEPGLDELLTEHLGRMTFTTDPNEALARATIAFVTVDTPPLSSGDADLSRVQAVLDAIPENVDDLVLVMKSTVPVNTGARIMRELAERGRTGVRYVSNPEFLREGSAVQDVFHPDRVVIGADDPDDAALVAELWKPLGGELLICDIPSAEMVKLASNAFLATKISFINEIANVCDVVGADVSTVATGMGLDARIGPAFLGAGIGYGGSCFPKDVTALKQLAGNAGYHFQLLASVIEVNTLQKRRVVTTLTNRLGSLDGKRIALLGLSFKPGTDDLREASSLVLAERLASERAILVVHDPVVGPEVAERLPRGTSRAQTIDEAITGADAAVIVTEWPQYQGLLDDGMAARMAQPLLVDGRNMLDPAAAVEAGYEWVGIGRGAAGSGARAANPRAGS